MVESSRQPRCSSRERDSGSDKDERVRQLREMVEQLRDRRGTIGTTCQLKQHVQTMDRVAKDILDSNGGGTEDVKQLCGQLAHQALALSRQRSILHEIKLQEKLKQSLKEQGSESDDERSKVLKRLHIDWSYSLRERRSKTDRLRSTREDKDPQDILEEAGVTITEAIEKAGASVDPDISRSAAGLPRRSGRNRKRGSRTRRAGGKNREGLEIDLETATQLSGEEEEWYRNSAVDSISD